MTNITVDRNASVFTVTIDRPKANAIDAETSRNLGEAFVEFRDDQTMRVAIITGAGDRFFSAGWDLKAAAMGEEYEADYGIGGFGGFPELPDLNKPVIAAVNGSAVGGGFELVLAADLVVSSEHAEFFFGEVAAGVIPDTGTLRLPRVVSPALAKEFILTGRRLSANEAKILGLVNRVVAANDLMTSAADLAEKICRGAPLAVEAVLAVMRQTSQMSVQQALDAMREGQVAEFSAMLESDDAKEGPLAFAEGRDPVWRGS